MSPSNLPILLSLNKHVFDAYGATEFPGSITGDTIILFAFFHLFLKVVHVCSTRSNSTEQVTMEENVSSPEIPNSETTFLFFFEQLLYTALFVVTFLTLE